jgi:UDP-2,3-diacylglucosamine hydrolase
VPLLRGFTGACGKRSLCLLCVAHFINFVMAVYFISDVHLGLGPRAEEREKENRLLALLQSILPDTEELYIVGDLFDFWFEYRTVIPKGFHRTLAVLQSFTDRGIPVKFLVGNHDCWAMDFFSVELGMETHRAPFEATIQGRRVYLHHGDGLATNDFGYRLIKPLLRHPVAVWCYRWLHPDLGVPLARGSSRTSRTYTSQKDYGNEEGLLRFARERIQEGIHIVVMGHRHQPILMPIDGGVYVNLGDWISCNTYAIMEAGTIRLATWTPH